MKSIKANIEDAINSVNKSAETLNLLGQQQLMARTLQSSLGALAKETVRTGRNRTAELNKMRENQLTAHKVESAKALAIAVRVSGMKTSDAVKLVLSNLDAAVSVHQNMTIAGLPAEVTDVLEEFIQRSNLERMLASQHNSRATLENPFASGPDKEALTTAAKAAIAGQRQAREDVQLLADTMRSMCEFAAVATGKDARVVFTELMAGA